MLWWTASKWTGHSERELARYKLESEREGNPEQHEGKAEAGRKNTEYANLCFFDEHVSGVRVDPVVTKTQCLSPLATRR